MDFNEPKPDTGLRFRVVSVVDGFNGRRKGRQFDVTVEEYARFGPDGSGEVEMVEDVGKAPKRKAAPRRRKK